MEDFVYVVHGGVPDSTPLSVPPLDPPEAPLDPPEPPLELPDDPPLEPLEPPEPLPPLEEPLLLAEPHWQTSYPEPSLLHTCPPAHPPGPVQAVDFPGVHWLPPPPLLLPQPPVSTAMTSAPPARSEAASTLICKLSPTEHPSVNVASPSRCAVSRPRIARPPWSSPLAPPPHAHARRQAAPVSAFGAGSPRTNDYGPPDGGACEKPSLGRSMERGLWGSHAVNRAARPTYSSEAPPSTPVANRTLTRPLRIQVAGLSVRLGLCNVTAELAVAAVQTRNAAAR
jgi:hypothetical protein